MFWNNLIPISNYYKYLLLYYISNWNCFLYGNGKLWGYVGLRYIVLNEFFMNVRNVFLTRDELSQERNKESDLTNRILDTVSSSTKD